MATVIEQEKVHGNTRMMDELRTPLAVQWILSYPKWLGPTLFQICQTCEILIGTFCCAAIFALFGTSKFRAIKAITC